MDCNGEKFVVFFHKESNFFRSQEKLENSKEEFRTRNQNRCKHLWWREKEWTEVKKFKTFRLEC